MTDKEKQEIADLVIKKMLQARSNMEKDLFNINDVLFTLLNTQLTQEEILVGELARLMTLMNLYEEKEEYEVKTLFRRSEICTVKVKEYSRYDNEEDTGDHFTDLGISTYSSSDNYSEFTLDRMLFTGQVALIIKDFKDDILADMNKVYKQHTKLTDKSLDKVNVVRDQIQEIEDQRSKFKHDIFMEDLKNGIELLDDKTASIQVRYDWHVGSIIAAKITRTSYSGKSVDLEVKTKGRSWNSETEKYEDQIFTKTLDKVRVSKLQDSFLNGYSNLTWKKVS